MTEPLTFTVEQAAQLLGIARGSAYEAARRGELPTIRLGRRLLVPRARLLELVGATDVSAEWPEARSWPKTQSEPAGTGSRKENDLWKPA